MKILQRKWALCCFITVLFGTALHFFYTFLPCMLSALLSPVSESIWEHIKLVFYPMLAAGLLCGAKEKERRSGWYWGTLFACGILLLFGWVYHILLGGTVLAVDIAAYYVIMAIGFLLADRMKVPGWMAGLGGILILTLFGLILYFTFSPPTGMLFADPALADAFYSLPV